MFLLDTSFSLTNALIYCAVGGSSNQTLIEPKNVHHFWTFSELSYNEGSAHRILI